MTKSNRSDIDSYCGKCGYELEYSKLLECYRCPKCTDGKIAHILAMELNKQWQCLRTVNMNDIPKTLTDLLGPMNLKDGFVWVDKTFTKEEWSEFKKKVNEPREVLEKIKTKLSDRQYYLYVDKYDLIADLEEILGWHL